MASTAEYGDIASAYHYSNSCCRTSARKPSETTTEGSSCAREYSALRKGSFRVGRRQATIDAQTTSRPRGLSSLDHRTNHIDALNYTYSLWRQRSRNNQEWLDRAWLADSAASADDSAFTRSDDSDVSTLNRRFCSLKFSSIDPPTVQVDVSNVL